MCVWKNEDRLEWSMIEVETAQTCVSTSELAKIVVIHRANNGGRA